MPLVIMCGFPSAGKSRRAAEIATFLEGKGKTVHVISDTSLGIDKRDGYLVAAAEKMTRGGLKSEVERLLNAQDVVILDSLNYIKGFRYELHCITRLLKTPLCCVHVATSQKQCMEWHKENGSVYGDELVEELFMRFECPDKRNRWDKPLFTLEPTEELPGEEIYSALYEQKQMKPTMATQSQPLSETNFLHELDRVTTDLVKEVTQSLSTAVVGDKIAVSGTSDKVYLSRMRTPAELRRIKRQFMSYTRMHPVSDVKALPGMFVVFINNA